MTLRESIELIAIVAIGSAVGFLVAAWIAHWMGI
jgi:hypothetical protein